MNDILLLTLMALATHRVTRFILFDTFPPIRGLRNWIIGTDGTALNDTRLEWLGELLSCHWCASIWVSAGLVTGTQVLTGDVAYPFLSWLACATVAAMVIEREEE
jgi:hypothetical protein